MLSNTPIYLQQFFSVLGSIHFQSHNPKYSRFGYCQCLFLKMAEEDVVLEQPKVKKKKYLVKFTNQADKWSTQFLFLKKLTSRETYAI